MLLFRNKKTRASCRSFVKCFLRFGENIFPSNAPRHLIPCWGKKPKLSTQQHLRPVRGAQPGLSGSPWAYEADTVGLDLTTFPVLHNSLPATAPDQAEPTTVIPLRIGEDAKSVLEWGEIPTSDNGAKH
jgi:hypothetical protein